MFAVSVVPQLTETTWVADIAFQGFASATGRKSHLDKEVGFNVKGKSYCRPSRIADAFERPFYVETSLVGWHVRYSSPSRLNPKTRRRQAITSKIVSLNPLPGTRDLYLYFFVAFLFGLHTLEST